MKKILVAVAAIAMVGCVSQSRHSQVLGPNDEVLSDQDYKRFGNGSSSYESTVRVGNGMYAGAVPGLVGGFAPTGQTPGQIFQLPGTGEGMSAMEQHGAAPFIIFEQPQTVGLAPNGTPCADCLTTSDLDPILGQFDNHESRIRALETTKKKGNVNAQPKKKGEPQQ